MIALTKVEMFSKIMMDFIFYLFNYKTVATLYAIRYSINTLLHHGL